MASLRNGRTWIKAKSHRNMCYKSRVLNTRKYKASSKQLKTTQQLPWLKLLESRTNIFGRYSNGRKCGFKWKMERKNMAMRRCCSMAAKAPLRNRFSMPSTNLSISGLAEKVASLALGHTSRRTSGTAGPCISIIQNEAHNRYCCPGFYWGNNSR